MVTSTNKDVFKRPAKDVKKRNKRDLYADVKMTSYCKDTDRLFFSVKTRTNGVVKTMTYTSEQINVLKKRYEDNEELSSSEYAIICILHDQDMIESDDPADFVGVSFTVDKRPMHYSACID